MSLFASFTTNPTITINLNNQEGRLRKTIRVQGGDPIDLPVYSGNENVSGTVDISVPPGKKIEHQGVRIEMIGQTGVSNVWSEWWANGLTLYPSELCVRV